MLVPFKQKTVPTKFEMKIVKNMGYWQNDTEVEIQKLIRVKRTFSNSRTELLPITIFLQ